jgi:NADPH-dependent 2,4-dienoyl-CoA reductase/sulfur reductase-like enzyme
MKQRIVVIGGDAAGMSAASQVKRQRPAWDVVVLEQGQRVSYAACGMPYYVEGLIDDIEELVEITPETFREKRGIDLRLGWRATAIDPAARTVTAAVAGGNEETVSYDQLLIATGARPLFPAGVKPGPRVLTIDSLATAARVRERARPGSRVAVIGGGFIGVEMVEAFAARGLSTHLVHRRTELARMFAPEISTKIIDRMAAEGVKLHLGSALEAVTESDAGVVVKTATAELTVDLVLLAVGVRPNSELAAAAGIECGVAGSIVVDEHLRTSADGVYAAGDCAQGRRLVDGAPIFSPLALKANREGLTAGLNMAGIDAKVRGTLGTAVTKVFDLGIARTGLTVAEARAAGFDIIEQLIETRSKARYYPGSGKLTVMVVAERPGGRVLGAQLAGPVEAVKRIDTFAVIIHQQMTLDEVMDLDLAYAPPFSPVWDPVLMAARTARKKL